MGGAATLTERAASGESSMPETTQAGVLCGCEPYPGKLHSWEGVHVPLPG